MRAATRTGCARTRAFGPWLGGGLRNGRASSAFVRDIEPGELLLSTPTGCGPPAQPKGCVFEYVYLRPRTDDRPAGRYTPRGWRSGRRLIGNARSRPTW